jgi:hypothetical protein
MPHTESAPKLDGVEVPDMHGVAADDVAQWCDVAVVQQLVRCRSAGAGMSGTCMVLWSVYVRPLTVSMA